MLMITIQSIIFLVRLFIPICRYTQTHTHTHCMSHPNMQLEVSVEKNNSKFYIPANIHNHINSTRLLCSHKILNFKHFTVTNTNPPTTQPTLLQSTTRMCDPNVQSPGGMHIETLPTDENNKAYLNRFYHETQNYISYVIYIHIYFICISHL